MKSFKSNVQNLSPESLPSWERGLKCKWLIKTGWTIEVAPLVGAWIEIKIAHRRAAAVSVAPLVGAWIEICKCGNTTLANRSLPSWERGLKLTSSMLDVLDLVVAPLVGAWIEIPTVAASVPNSSVAPLVGAWIEIPCSLAALSAAVVAPLVGAWIEIIKW